MEMANFNSVLAKNPINEPNPEVSALPKSFPPISSPITAPKKGPNIMPKGRKNIPIIVPARQPRLPHLLPPIILLPKEGTM